LAKAKSIAVNAARHTAHAAHALQASMSTASKRRDARVSLVANKAAFYNARAAHTTSIARYSVLADAKQLVAKVESKQAAADYLRALDQRVRQSKAALTKQRVANVVERQRMTNATSPMLRGAKMRATQSLAEERRHESLTQVASKAGAYTRPLFSST
jgi:predicted negative regulator of RcsB-dependent stress response